MRISLKAGQGESQGIGKATASSFTHEGEWKELRYSRRFKRTGGEDSLFSACPLTYLALLKKEQLVGMEN